MKKELDKGAEIDFGENGDKFVVTERKGLNGTGTMYLAKARLFRNGKEVEKDFFIKYSYVEDEYTRENSNRWRREKAFKMYHPFIVQMYGGVIGFSKIGEKREEVRVTCADNLEGELLLDYIPQLYESYESDAVKEEKVLRCMLQLLAGVYYYLNYSKRDPFIHRDLKPENIMIITEPETKELQKVVIFDFDFAHNSNSRYTGTSRRPVWGTAGYADPLLTTAINASPEFDIYSLGRVFCYCLIGKDYFKECEMNFSDENSYTRDEKLAYGLRHDRFPSKYWSMEAGRPIWQEKYSPLMKIIERMVAKPEEKKTKSISAFWKEMNEFLKKYYGEEEYYRFYQKAMKEMLQTPYKAQEREKKITYVFSEMKDGKITKMQYSYLGNYGINTLSVGKGQRKITIYNLDGKLYYILYGEEEKAEDYEIKDSKEFLFGEIALRIEKKSVV